MLPVIILGSGNSGSSAVLDYLRGRGDVRDPLGGQEFRLIQEKDGLSSLHRTLTVECHPEAATYAVMDFARLAARLGADSRKLAIPPRLGYGFSRRLPEYDAAIAEFLTNITACSFGIFPLQDLLQLSTLDWIRFKTVGLRPSRRVVAPKPVPVAADEFMEHAKRLIARLFYERHAGEPIIAFDQAGSFWSPVSSTQYFGDARRVILVTRDPCDVFASQRRKKNILGSADEFAGYVRALRALIARDEWSDERVLHVTFEDFVLDHAHARERICAHLRIDSRATSTYDPAASRKSVGRYKDSLKPDEVEAIRAAWPAGAW